MTLRRIAALVAALLCMLFTSASWAGSYLDRAALMLDGARKEGDMLLPRTHDKELVLVIKALTAARAKAGRKMEVPPAIAKAHPHLLLVFENYERAADAAGEGNFKKFVEHLNTAREEERTFRFLVTELRYTLPDLNKR
jgi:hypothetical protein